MTAVHALYHGSNVSTSVTHWGPFLEILHCFTDVHPLALFLTVICSIVYFKAILMEVKDIQCLFSLNFLYKRSHYCTICSWAKRTRHYPIYHVFLQLFKHKIIIIVKVLEFNLSFFFFLHINILTFFNKQSFLRIISCGCSDFFRRFIENLSFLLTWTYIIRASFINFVVDTLASCPQISSRSMIFFLLFAFRLRLIFLRSKSFRMPSSVVFVIIIKLTQFRRMFIGNWIVVTWGQSIAFLLIFYYIVSPVFNPWSINNIWHLISIIILLNWLTFLGLVSLGSSRIWALYFLLHPSCWSNRSGVVVCTIILNYIYSSSWSSIAIWSDVLRWLIMAYIGFLWVTFAHLVIFKVLITRPIIKTIIRVNIRVEHS